MKKFNLLFTGFLFFTTFANAIFSTVEAQTVFFYEDCGNSAPSTIPRPSPADYTGWTNYGIDNIIFSGTTDVRSTAYDNSHVWFAANSVRTLEIRGVNSSEYKDITLSFRIQSNSSAAVNVSNFFSVTCIDSDNATYPINLPTISSVQNQWVTVSNLTGIPSTGNLTLVFSSSVANAAGFRLDDITLSGNLNEENSTTVNFKITTWNIDWLSCQDLNFNTIDRNLQMNNAVSVIKAMNSDFVALQEIGTSNMYTTIDTLVLRLGNEWAGNIVPWSNTNCDQNQGIIYKKAKIELVNSSLITNGGSYNNWSNGRYPVLYNVNFLIGSMEVPVSFVNIHAKSSSDETSYTRRQGASAGLKSLLDLNAYKTRKVVVMGDFNDYLVGNLCYTCNSSDSPYKNFMDDTDNYQGVTKDLIGSRGTPEIDNIIISKELFDNYVFNSSKEETYATQSVIDYWYSTSSHVPISAMLRFEKMGTGKILRKTSPIRVYPNPGSGIFTISNEEFSVNDKIEIFSIEGLLLRTYTVQTTDTTVDLTVFPAGYYIVKVKNNVAKILKI